MDTSGPGPKTQIPRSKLQYPNPNTYKKKRLFSGAFFLLYIFRSFIDILLPELMSAKMQVVF